MAGKVEVCEAICSAFYQMPFTEFLGEFEEKGEWKAWFHIGEKPKDMRVTITRHRDHDDVKFVVEWLNFWADARNPLKCQQTLTISTAGAIMSDLHLPTQAAVERCLEIYRDVLTGEGVAGEISKLQPDAPESEEE